MQTIAGITILVNNRKESQGMLNDVLSKYGHVIHGRLGIPHIQNDTCVISLVVQGSEKDIDGLYSELTAISSIEKFKVMIAKF